LNDAETIIQTITSIPKDVEDYAKIIFNSERPEDEGELLVLINDQVIVLDIQGRQIDAAPIQEQHSLLKIDNMSVLNNGFIYQLLCQSF
jgi:hypothetical protein